MQNIENIDSAKKKIEEFKKQLLTDTSIIEGKITALNKAISNTEFTDDLEEKNREFKKVAGKVLSGTQLKQDVYEENTNLWIKAAFDKTGYWEYRLKTSN